MKVSAEDLGNCQIALNIEADASELDQALDEAYRHLVNRVTVPGFRKGKAPRAVLVQHVGKNSLMQEALEHLMPKLYKQAVESEKLDPITEPQIEVVQTEPVIFKAVVSVKPKVKLGDYHSIKLEPGKAADISDDEVKAAMEQVRERQGAWVPAERAVELGDLVTIDIQASIDGRPWLNHKGIQYEVDKDSISPVLGFASYLVGAEKNKEIAFSLTVPDDYPIKEMCGKTATFEVLVTETKEKQLPQLNDELARSAGYESLDDMKKKLADHLKARAEARNRLELRQKALDALVEMSEVKYPPVLEDEEIAELLRDEAERLGFRDVADYLRRVNRTEQEAREKLRPVARRRVAQSLVLGQLAQEEKIEISSAEVDNKISEIVDGAEDKEKARQFFTLPQVRQSVERSLWTQKTMDRLLQIAFGEGENMTKGE